MILRIGMCAVCTLGPALLLLGCRSAALAPARPAPVAPVSNARTAAHPLERAVGWRLGPTRLSSLRSQPTGSGRALRRAPLDLHLGLGLGAAFAGDQDLKLRQFDANSQPVDALFSDDVDESVGPFASLFLTAWGRGWARHFGAQLDASYWTTEARPRSVVDQGTLVARPLPPIGSIHQDRVAVFVSLLGRLPLGRSSCCVAEAPYVFGGIGGGLVYSDVERGEAAWGAGVQAILGTSVPLNRRLRLRLDVRYLLVPDVDSSAVPGLRVDTSGTPTWPRWKHRDTRFLVLMAAVEHRF